MVGKHYVDDADGWGDDVPSADVSTPVAADTDTGWGDDVPSADPAAGWEVSTRVDDGDGWGSDVPSAGGVVPSMPDIPMGPDIPDVPVGPDIVVPPPDTGKSKPKVKAGKSAKASKVKPSEVPVLAGASAVAAVPVMPGTEDEPDVEVPPARRKRRSKAIGGVRVTTQDHQIISFAGRYKVCTVSQLSRMFDRSEMALRNRMPRLERAGLVDSYYGAENRTKIWTATEAGMKTVQMHLPGTTQIAWGALRHQLHLTDIGIVMENAGEIVLTEREIRAASLRRKRVRGVDEYYELDAPTPRMQTAYEQSLAALADDEDDDVSVADLARTTYTVPIVGRKTGHGRIPDMVLLRQSFDNGMPGSIAIELELTRKTLSEWKLTVESYVRHTGYAQVHYFFTSREMMRSFYSVVKSVPGGAAKVQVSIFKPVDQSWNPKAGRRR